MSLLLPGEESAVIEPGRTFTRHHHAAPYAAVLVQGSCHEMSDHGRAYAAPGDVFVHAAFDGHADIVGQQGAVFINLALDEPIDGWYGRLCDVDAFVKTYERDPRDAAKLLKEQFQAGEGRQTDWPDLLADHLRTQSRFSLAEWAEGRGLHRTTVSHGFRRAYGIAPQRFRFEQMASHAARQIRETRDPLVVIAARCGFSDQPHMSRAIAAIFGTTALALRCAAAGRGHRN